MSHALPLPDYDSLPVGSIESRVRTLDETGVRALLDYEREHANRTQVVQILENRLLSLRRGEAEPSGGSPLAPAPEGESRPTSGGEQASPASEGPPQNPPSHGVPTNPSQPRRWL
jgi:hypothetical protein